MYFISFLNGYWVVGSAGYIAYATSLSGTWIQNSNYFDARVIYDAIYFNNRYIFLGSDASCYLDSLNQSPILLSGDTLKVSGGNGHPLAIPFNSEVIVLGNTSSVGGYWFEIDATMTVHKYTLPSANSNVYPETYVYVPETRTWASLYFRALSSTSWILYAFYAKVPVRLPLLSTDKAYVYIKAEGGTTE